MEEKEESARESTVKDGDAIIRDTIRFYAVTFDPMNLRYEGEPLCRQLHYTNKDLKQ